MDIKKYLKERREKLISEYESYSKLSEPYCKIIKELKLIEISMLAIKEHEGKLK